MMKIVSNCPLCGEKSLHVMEQDGIGTQQCINCGMATSSNFMGTKKDNETFETLPDEMKSWSKEANGRILIPSMITLPFGTLYPVNIDGEMKWGFDIPEEEQKNYPKENGDGLHTMKYDTDNQKVYDKFLYAMDEMNKRAKADGPSEIQPQ